MGALSCEPGLSQYSGGETPLALDRLAEESAIMLAGDSEQVFEELLKLSGSSAGARPKIVAQVSADKTKILHGPRELKHGFEQVTIGGANASVSFSGLTPGYPGLYQINAVEPDGVSGASVPVVLSVAGQTSPPVTLAVQ